MVGFSHCFRHEVGSAGTENKGLYRLHQFSKVELLSICKEEHSDSVLGRAIELQKEILDELGLHYQ